MKKICLIFLLILCSSFLFARGEKEDFLTVYAYDSFCSDWGPGVEIATQFEKETGVKVKYVNCAGAVQLYTKLLYEGENCPADVVIGLPDFTDIDESLFMKWKPQCASSLEYYYENSNLIPFDYGIYAFAMNRNSEIEKPTSLAQLTENKYRKKFILVDPRTSSVGLGLLMWTVRTMGEDNAVSWWKTAVKNAVTTAESWSSAYGLFLEGEAPLVITYTTSPVYHKMNNDGKDIEALEFDEGHIITEEYLAIMNSSDKKELAQQFCNMLLTEWQDDIASSNTMFPANRETVLPDAYDAALRPSNILNMQTDPGYTEKLLDKWTDAVI